MSSAFLLAVGSRGDTEPICALAISLISEGAIDQVHLCLQPEYSFLAPQHPQITTHYIPVKSSTILGFMLFEFFKDGVFSLFTGRFDAIVAQNRGLTKLHYYCIPRFFSFLRTLIDELRPDVIVSTSTFSFTAVALARYRGIPFAAVHFQPLHPTTLYPYMLRDIPTSMQVASDIAASHLSDSPIRNEDHLLSYDKVMREFFGASLPKKYNDFREELGLKRIMLDDVHDVLYPSDEKILTLYAYPAELVPRDPRWKSNVHVVDALADAFIPPGWTPEKMCPKTLEYLEKSDRPLLVTFGSMSVPGCTAWASRQVLQGLRDAKIEEVLVLKGSANLGAHNLNSFWDGELIEWAEKHVFYTEERPYYSWLMPHCLAVLCHGGSGTIFASLRAGLPAVVAPVAADQFFWGRLVEDMHLGARVEPGLRAADANAYVQAFNTAMRNEVSEKTRTMADKISRRDTGASKASKLIAELVS